KNRPDLPFRKIFILFTSFITLCGITHIMGIVVIWIPAYGIEGLLMLATGIVSAITAVVIWKALPAAISLPNITEYQQLNEELKEAYAEVEHKVFQRTKDLEQQKRKLEIANEAKKRFVADMSHEIR